MKAIKSAGTISKPLKKSACLAFADFQDYLMNLARAPAPVENVCCCTLASRIWKRRSNPSLIQVFFGVGYCCELSHRFQQRILCLILGEQRYSCRRGDYIRNLSIGSWKFYCNAYGWQLLIWTARNEGASHWCKWDELP